MKPDLSVIIPALNEDANLPCLLADLERQTLASLEVIVADGGSTDTTVEIAQKFAAQVVKSKSGRGLQMNHGAAIAKADYLLFLHADSRINSPTLLEDALAHFRIQEQRLAPKQVAGHFSIKFERQESEFVDRFSFYEAKSALNRPSTTNGDQGFLIARSFFSELGGFFEELPFLEDQELAERIREQGSWITLPGVLVTSTRRFEQEGFARRMILSAMIMGLFSIRLDQFFKKVPEVYQKHCLKGELLNLPPICRLIHTSLWKDGVRKGFKRWYGIGRYVKENAWQLFYLREYHKPKHEQKLLRFHDQYYEPLTRDPAWYTATMLMTMAWFYSTWLFFSVMRLRPARKRAMTPGSTEEACSRPNGV